MTEAEAKAALAIAKRALWWYADKRNWGNDDWGVKAVVQPPEYGKPGTKARNALAKIQRAERRTTTGRDDE